MAMTNFSSQERKTYLEQFPDAESKNTMLAMMGYGNIDTDLMTFQMMANDYCLWPGSAHNELAMQMGLAGLRWCDDLTDHEDISKQHLHNQISNFYNCISKALLNQQRLSEVIEHTKLAVEHLEKLGVVEYVPTLCLRAAEALYDTQEFQESQRMIDHVSQRPINSADQSSLKRIQDLLHKRMGKATDLPSDEAQSEKIARENREMYEDIFESLNKMSSGAYGREFNKLKGELIQKEEAEKLLSKEELFKKYQASYAQFASLMKGTPGVEDDLNAITLRQHNAMKVFVADPEKDNTEALRKSEAEFKAIIEWARNNGNVSYENDSLWFLSLCYTRLEEDEENLEVLQSLRTNLEASRKSITDPVERAGVMALYPNLFPVLVGVLYRLDRPMDMLKAIESSKNRVLCDLLTQLYGQSHSEITYSEVIGEIPQLTREHSFNYLSIFVDKEISYAVLIDKNGKAHAYSIPIGKNELAKWIRGEKDLNPAFWGSSSLGFFGEQQSELNTRLAPYIEWLSLLLVKDDLKSGDHICYSADEELNQVPLHFLPLNGEPAIRQFSFSRIPNALTLQYTLNQRVTKYNKMLVFEVPAKQDQDLDLIEGLSKTGNWMQKAGIDGVVFKGTSADLAKIISIDLSNKVVHFATHGTFPHSNNSDIDLNPYINAGLLIATNGTLPDKDKVREGKGAAELLSPKQIIESKLNLKDSHISLQACVSGLSREGIGGDALGMEWALLQSGATSLLSSHWQVKSQSSADFMISFYDKWLKQKKTRGAAWRETALEFMDSGKGNEGLRDWAAFSLTGNWN